MLDHLALFKRKHGVVVVDRFVATEWVMSTAHERTNPRQLMQEVLDINMHLNAMAVIQVILLPTLPVLASRLAERGAGGRLWDMEQSLIHPLWRTAHAIITNAAIYYNNQPKDQEILVDRLVNMVTTEKHHAVQPHA
jgi:hypothetical protein